MSSQGPSGANLQKLVGTATAVVGGIALMTKLGIDEIQHRQMKQKTDPSNAYSSIRILPDLVRFQGYIRIYRHRGNIVCPVPRKIEDVKRAQTHLPDDNGNGAGVETEAQTPAGDTGDVINDVADVAISDDSDENHNNHNKQESNVEIKWLSGSNADTAHSKDTGWFQSFSSFASNAKKSINKLHTMYEEKTVDFNSDFPFTLRDSAIHKNDMESYVLTNNRFLDLFEPLPMIQTADQQHHKQSLPLYEQWEFCPVKIHHETLFIRYANKWITLPLNRIYIAPFALKDTDCTAFIVDYQKYFTISEEKGYVLICQHLDDPCIECKEDDIDSPPIKIPSEHSLCPWPYVQQYVIGFHDTSFVSLRKKHVLKCIVEKVSNAMKDVGFDNLAQYKHAIQFRKCIDSIVSNLEGAEKALLFKQKQQKDTDTDENEEEEEDDDDDVDMSSKQEANDMKELNEDQEEHKSETIAPSQREKQKEEILPYLNLLNDAYHGLNVHDVSEIDWKLAAEASWLSNYVYDIHKPQSPQSTKPRRNSWTHFRSYISMGSSASNLKELLHAADNERNENHNKIEHEEEEIEYRGPPHFHSDPLWKSHSDKHYKNMSKFGFELLDYAITQKGQSVQYLITRSYDNPSTIFLTFKGTSNPLDGMVNIGLHPLYLDYFQCSIFSGMYAALQQSLAFVCRKLNIYSSDEYFQNHPCPPHESNVTKIYKLVICGHSLGGGYAQIFLAHLLSASEFENYFETIKCITFGSPLVFCKDVRNSFFYEKLNEKCLNFVYQFDLVPRLQNGMDTEYRCKLLQNLLMSQLPVSNIGMVFDINERLNYVLHKFQEHQWLLDRYCYVGKYIVLFEKDEPKSIDKKQKCFTKSATSYHLSLAANTVLRMTSILPKDEPIFAEQVLNDHKMLNYMKTIMFQQF